MDSETTIDFIFSLDKTCNTVGVWLWALWLSETSSYPTFRSPLSEWSTLSRDHSVTGLLSIIQVTIWVQDKKSSNWMVLWSIDVKLPFSYPTLCPVTNWCPEKCLLADFDVPFGRFWCAFWKILWIIFIASAPYLKKRLEKFHGFSRTL